MPILRRRPVLRAAAIVGGSYRAAKRRLETEEREPEQRAGGARFDATQSTARPATVRRRMSEATTQRLELLCALRKQGLLTNDEFAKQKAALLGG